MASTRDRHTEPAEHPDSPDQPRQSGTVKASAESGPGSDDRDREHQRDALGTNSKAAFAHPSEEEFARILDFYHVEWQYEPRTFPIEWDVDGNVVSAFTPDFYLPVQDLFIEITTLKQALVTKKNRKVRRMRELYPEINLRVLYVSDFRKLIEKFVASGLNPKLRVPRNSAGSNWGNGAQK
jgi:hypothetical protein